VKTFDANTSALLAEQRDLWPTLAPTVDLGFTLYGGTALSLRLGHRASIDFDFFSDKPLLKRELQSLPALRNAQVIQDEPTALTVLATTKTESVKLSFFGGISFGRVSEPELTNDHVLEVASMYDLFATKLKVLFDRVDAKDYRDIAAILRAGHHLDEGLAAGRALFGSQFQPAEVLKFLTYFEGATFNELSKADREILEKSATAVTNIPNMTIISKALAQRRGLGQSISPNTQRCR